MSNTPQWTPCAAWLGKTLSIDRGGEFSSHITRASAAAGFKREQLAAAFVAIGAEVSSDGQRWFQADARVVAYWRRHAAVQSIVGALPPAGATKAAPHAAPVPAKPAPTAPIKWAPTVPTKTFEQHHAECLARAARQTQTAPPPTSGGSINAHELYARRRKESGH